MVFIDVQVRWLFNDRTKNKVVHLHIISKVRVGMCVCLSVYPVHNCSCHYPQLPPANGENHSCYVVSVQEQEGGGADISSVVLSKMKEEPKQVILQFTQLVLCLYPVASTSHNPSRLSVESVTSTLCSHTHLTESLTSIQDGINA